MNIGSVNKHKIKDATNNVINRAHSFPRAVEFRAEPRNLAVAAKFPYFRGISRNSA